MRPDHPLKLAIIGAGNLGTSLAVCFAKRGHRVRLGSRSLEQQQQNVEHLSYCSYIDAVSNADLVFLTVPDDVIESTCQELSTHLSNSSLVTHCSGALTSNILQSAKARGCAVASAHPLNTFPSRIAGIKTLLTEGHSTALYYEGDSEIETILVPIMQSVGFKPYSIDADAKTLYHAACVFSCNLTTALLEVSLQTAEAAQLDRQEYWQAIQPLLSNTLANIGEHGTAAALSGPIARGDLNTVTKQTELLADLPNDLNIIYKDLSRVALSLAVQNAILPQESIEALNDLLKGTKE